jgi:uncharacterized protein GlcG (DUF336 family)
VEGDVKRGKFEKVLDMRKLTLQEAISMANGVLQRGRTIGCNPLAVAVLDEGGHVKVLFREDGAGILRPEIAIGKAWGALGLGQPTRVIAERVLKMPAFFTAVAALAGGKVIPVPGGVLVRSQEGDLVGAVGVSGDKSEKDEECAVYGIDVAGFKAQTGEQV